MPESIPDRFRKLTNKEFRVLLAIENKMRFYEWVPVEELIRFTGYSPKDVAFILSNLTKKELVQRNISAYEGYRIYFEAYDLLALKVLVKRGSIYGIGEVIGAGKESCVYRARGGITNRQVIIKFHREGRMGFKHVRKKRGYTQQKQWLYTACIAAKREYHALVSLYPKVRVPQPIDHNRHAVVMSVIKGKELAYTIVEQPEWYLNDILNQIRRAYKLGFIHGDLSEFNIMVHAEGCEIIDWPQYVTTDHLNAKELLYQDMSNILNFFNRKYGIKKDMQKAIRYICQKE